MNLFCNIDRLFYKSLKKKDMNKLEKIAYINSIGLRISNIDDILYYNVIDVSNILKIKSPRSTLASHVNESSRMKLITTDSRGIEQSTNYVNRNGLLSILLSGADNLQNEDEKLKVFFFFSGILHDDLILYRKVLSEYSQARMEYLKEENESPLSCWDAYVESMNPNSTTGKSNPVEDKFIDNIPTNTDTKILNQNGFYNVFDLFRKRGISLDLISDKSLPSYRSLHENLKISSILINQEVFKRPNGGYYYNENAFDIGIERWTKEWGITIL